MTEASNDRPMTPGRGSGGPLQVFVLACHKNVEMTIPNLSSLRDQCRDPIALIVQDDGSLTPEDRGRLVEALGPIRIIGRAEADELVAPALAGKGRCREFRRANPLALKVIDAPVLAGGPFALCDVDILFLRPFEGLDRRPCPGEDLVFMRDFINSYGSPWQDQFFGAYRSRRVDFLNSGLLYGAPRAFDLDFAEWYLGNPTYDLAHCHAEQRLWAALAARVDSHYFDPRQIAFPTPSFASDPRWVALHYITPLRFLLEDPDYLANLRARGDRAAAEGTATLETRPAIYANIAQHVVRRLARKIHPHYIEQAIYTGPLPIDAGDPAPATREG